MPTDPPPEMQPFRASRLLLTTAILSSALLVASRIFLSLLDPGPALPGPLRFAFDTVSTVLPWLWGLATSVLVWAAVSAIRQHHLTEWRTWAPVGIVGSALILAIWFPWDTLSYLEYFSFSLGAAVIAVLLGYLPYPALRRRYSLGRYTSFLVLSVFGLAFLGYTAGYLGPVLLTPQANQGALLGIFMTGPLGAFLGLGAFWAYVYTHRRA